MLLWCLLFVVHWVLKQFKIWISSCKWCSCCCCSCCSCSCCCIWCRWSGSSCKWCSCCCCCCSCCSCSCCCCSFVKRYEKDKEIFLISGQSCILVRMPNLKLKSWTDSIFMCIESDNNAALGFHSMKKKRILRKSVWLWRMGFYFKRIYLEACQMEFFWWEKLGPLNFR